METISITISTPHRLAEDIDFCIQKVGHRDSFAIYYWLEARLESEPDVLSKPIHQLAQEYQEHKAEQERLDQISKPSELTWEKRLERLQEMTARQR